jgi:hypothetical protein
MLSLTIPILTGRSKYFSMQEAAKLKISKFLSVTLCLVLLTFLFPFSSSSWYDETHLAIAKVAGYEKWFNAAGPDVAKLKMGDKEGHNHFVNNPKGTVVTPEVILAQVGTVQPA